MLKVENILINFKAHTIIISGFITFVIEVLLTIYIIATSIKNLKSKSSAVVYTVLSIILMVFVIITNIEMRKLSDIIFYSYTEIGNKETKLTIVNIISIIIYIMLIALQILSIYSLKHKQKIEKEENQSCQE